MSEYGTILYTGPSGPTHLYSGSSNDQLQSLDFYRTEIDGDYVFHWTFPQSFISPGLVNLDYILQLDTNSSFSMPTSFETVTEVADNIIASGYSRSGAYADINAPLVSNWTLILNIDGDGAQTITLAGNTSGAAIAANVQTLVRALTPNNPALANSYLNFAATYTGIVGQYVLTSGGTGISSSVVVLGGTGASPMMLGLSNGGYQVTGNTFILSQLPGGILSVTDNTGVTYVDVSATTNNPGSNQFVASIPLGLITLNSANLPDVVTIVYFPSTSAPIFGFQNGNVEKAFTVPVPSRVASASVTFYARVAIRYSYSSFGPWSETLTALTIPNVVNETFSRLMLGLSDFHVYPTDNAYLLAGSLVDGVVPNPLPAGLSNIAKVYLAYTNEFDTEYLEKENCIRDVRQDRVRDSRIGSTLGALYKYPQPINMQNVDYRLILSNMKAASLNGGTYQAVKLVGAAFTGVDPTIFPISQILNFITAGFTNVDGGGDYRGVVQNIRVNGSFQATLSEDVAADPIIPGSLISGPVVSVSESHAVSSSSPYTFTLSHIPANIPVIAGYTFTLGTPTATQFNVNYSTGVLKFNVAAAGLTLAVSYIPNYESELPGKSLAIAVDGLAPQTITFGVGPFTTKAQVAEDIQSQMQAIGSSPYSNFLAIYDSSTDTYTLVSGNRTPTSASSVVVSASTTATQLRLLVANGAIATTGLTYETPPTVPAPGQFVSNIAVGNGSLLTFPAVEVGNYHTVLFLPKTKIFTYLPGKTVESFTVPGSSPYVVTLPTGGDFFDGASCDIPVVCTSVAGTVAVTSNSNAVVGSGTTFTALSVGDNVVFASQLGNDVDYYVESIPDNTHLTLASSYEGTTAGSTKMGVLTDSFQFIPTPTVVVPPTAVPPTLTLTTGQFTCDFASPANLRFASSFAGEVVFVSYTVRVPVQGIDTIKDHPILFSAVEAGFGIEIILNNPGLFTLDLKNIAFLLTEILPANTKFILTEAT